MIKKPKNWDSLMNSLDHCNCPLAYIIGYYLSRFDRSAYKRLGFGNMTETHEKIGSLLEVSSNTIKNFRDAFDPYHENNRKGWWKRKLWRFEEEIYEGFQIYSEEEIYSLVISILKNPKGNFKYFFESNYFDLDDNSKYLFPDEIRESEMSLVLKEGSIQQIQVNAYERNSQARQKCIEYYGSNCMICGFDFGDTFGEIGKNFIHVHHLTPLSKIHQEYEVDPVKDLRPVCPNCHAMIHRKDPPFTLEEIKDFINKK